MIRRSTARFKDHSGLSLSSPHTKAGYSRASWERYLKGKALPPRQAMEELARVVGVDPARVLALHEAAEEGWKEDPDASKTADPPKPRRTRRCVDWRPDCAAFRACLGCRGALRTEA
ncbi:helix-turn-helix domain-containing protein [Streptomyces sp. NPDC059740]|uniref:helix-turn-helix domain-containing protein n=1 Tax=Streptomyces sp. NPDC059740 TaxID=3346926 RepID=UPI003648D9E2